MGSLYGGGQRSLRTSRPTSAGEDDRNTCCQPRVIMFPTVCIRRRILCFSPQLHESLWIDPSSGAEDELAPVLGLLWVAVEYLDPMDRYALAGMASLPVLTTGKLVGSLLSFGGPAEAVGWFCCPDGRPAPPYSLLGSSLPEAILSGPWEGGRLRYINSLGVHQS